VLLVIGWLAGATAQAFTDGFEAYTNGTTFVAPTNGWQASSALVAVQTNSVIEGTNAVISPESTVLTNSVTPDITATNIVWTDYWVNPPRGEAPAVGVSTSATDSVRLFFDRAGYVNIDSNRTWIQCSRNVAGTPVTPITTQWVRVSVLVDYSRTNAAVFLNGGLLSTNIPLPGAMATNYHRVFWDNSGTSTGFLDSVSITPVWPEFATNSLTDLDDDGMLDAEELQVYGNLSTYHRPNIHLVTTNLTMGGSSGGSAVPAVDFTVRPNAGTNFIFNADPGYHVWDVLTNGSTVGSLLAGKGTIQAMYTNNAFSGDTTVTVQFKTNPIVRVVSTNVTVGGLGGGTVVPTTNVDVVVYPAIGTNFTMWANTGYHVYDVLTNGVSDGAALSGRYTGLATYTNSSLWTNTTVTVQFRSNFLVTASAGTGGSITPSPSVVVYPGTNLVIAITSSPAYVVATITNNGAPDVSYTGQKVVAYPLNNVQANTSLQVTFSYTSNRTVGASGDYPTLNAATAAALAGDTIQVSNGTYQLSAPVVITNRITLRGNTNSPGSVWVQAPTGVADMDCFQVRTNGVTIEGFLMTGATNGAEAAGSGYLNAGIMVGNDAASNQMAAVRVLTNLGNGTFLFNQYSNCTHGVYVMAATNCLVSQSEFLDNTMTGVWASVSTDARSNWWGTATGPGPVGPGVGSPISLYVVTMPWWESAARAARVIYTNAPGLQAALDLAVAGDVVWTTNGPYAGDLVIDRAVRFLTGFSLDGKITFSNNVTLTAAYTCTNAAVASNVTVSITTGGSLTAANLVIHGSGLVVGNGGTAHLSADGLTRTGNFTANQHWGTLVASTLDFSDNFETYSQGSALTLLGLNGWSATDDGVVVQTNTVASGTNAVILPPETEVDNTVSTLATRIWTDYRCRPVLGDVPATAATSNQSLRLSFDTNGWLVVDATNGWQLCSTNVMGGAAPQVSNQWVRISVFQDYQAKEQAVFLDGILVQQQLAFVGSNATAYTKLLQFNTCTASNAYMDAVYIGTNLPAGLASDINSDGVNDASDIHNDGKLTTRPRGTIFKIR
jgi:hypothetical protein